MLKGNGNVNTSSKDILVQDTSKLIATGTISGANITTDGDMITGGTEPASGISGASITATGKVEGASISAQAGNISAASVKATTGNITATGDVTASNGTISARNLSAAAVTASGNGTISGSLTVNGGINAGSQKITNVADPTANADAANKQYVDSKLATAGKTYTGAAGINVDGTTISVKADGTNIITDTNGNITLGKNITGLTGISAETVNASRVTGLADPTADSDAVSKKYVDTQISSIDASFDGNMGNRSITNLAAANADTDAVNFKQMKDADAAVLTTSQNYADAQDATFLEQANEYTNGQIAANDKLNVKYNADKTAVDIDGASFITKGAGTFGSVAVGGLSITDGRITGLNDPTADSDAVSKKYVQGLIDSIDTTGFTGDMGNKKITNLAAGTEETDAVNKKQLDDAIQNVTAAGFSGDMKNGKIVNLAEGTADNDAVNVKQMKDADSATLTSAKKYADDQDKTNLQSAKDYADAQITASDALNVKYNADKTALDIGGASFITKGAGSFGSVAVGGLSITDGRITGLNDPTADNDAVSKKYVQGLISAIDTTGFTGDMKSQKITNLAAGTEETDAVNKKQLDDAIQNVTAAGFSGDMKNGKIVNLAEGTADTDAVNVKQMKDADTATLTSAKKYADDQDKTNLQSAKDYADQQVNAADALNVKYSSEDKTAVNIGGASFTTTGTGSFGSVAVGSTSVTNGRITGIVTSSIKDKLDAVNKEYVDTAVANSSAAGGKTYKAGNGIAISADDTISVVRGRVADKNNGFVTGGDVYASVNPLRNSLTVMDGKLADQAALINTMQNSVSEIGGKVNSIISSVSSITGSFADNNLSNLSGTGLNVIQQEARKAVANYINTSGLTSFKAVTPMAKTYSVSAYSAENTTPASEKAGNDLSAVSDRVSANETAIKKNTEDITDLRKAEGIDSDAWAKTLGTGKIGKDDNRLVTGSTVYSAMEKKADLDYVNALGEGLSQKIDMTSSRLTKDIAKAGAGAAALAALHPQDYDPDSKLDFAAGVGNYKSETATAIGLYYRPNSGTMFSLSGTIGNGNNMVNAGVSIKVGYGKNVEKVMITRTLYDRQQKENQELRNTVTEQKEELDAQREEIEQLKAAVTKLVAQNR